MTLRPRCMVLSALGVFATATALAPPRGGEPPLRLAVEVEGKTVEVSDGKPFTLKVGEKDVAMKVSVLPTRLFSAGGITFEFPRDMTFERDASEEGMRIWSFTGADTMLMVQRYEGQTAKTMLGTVVKSTVDEFEGAAKETKKVPYGLAGQKLEASRVEIGLAGSTILQDYVGLESKDAGIILMIQDSSDGKAQCDETRKLVQLLAQTLKVER